MPNCLNPRLLVVFTRQLEILVTALRKPNFKAIREVDSVFSVFFVPSLRHNNLSDLEMIMHRQVHVFIFLLRKPFFKIKRKSLSLHFSLSISVLTIIINQLLTTVSAKRVTAGNKRKVYVSYP